MASTKEIQYRIKSIKDTMKITSAYYLISSTKLKSARKKLIATEPYFFALQSIISRMLRHMPDIQSVYFEKNEDSEDVDAPAELSSEKSGKKKKRGYMVITGDKGLAGAYHHNIFNMVKAEEEKTDVPICYYVVGELGRQFLRSKKAEISSEFLFTAQDPNIHRARQIALRLLEDFDNGAVNEIFVIYTKMISGMQSEVETVKLLPLEPQKLLTAPAGVYQEEFVLWPSPEAVIKNLIPDYLAGFIYGVLVEAYSSEQNARMMAMDAANKSAGDMLKELAIEYNRVRQAAITQEITEVVGGAKALKRKK